MASKISVCNVAAEKNYYLNAFVHEREREREKEKREKERKEEKGREKKKKAEKHTKVRARGAFARDDGGLKNDIHCGTKRR